MSPYHWGKFQTNAFHVAPSIGPIVSVMNLQGRQSRSRKADQSAKPDNGTVYVWFTSVAINWANNME